MRAHLVLLPRGGSHRHISECIASVSVFCALGLYRGGQLPALYFYGFFELSVTHKRNSAVGVDIVVAHLPEKARKVMDIISTVLTLGIWLVLVYLGAKLAITTTSTCTTYLRIPYHYIYWFFPISGFFCVVQLIRRLVLIIRGEEYVEKLDFGEDGMI